MTKLFQTIAAAAASAFVSGVVSAHAAAEGAFVPGHDFSPWSMFLDANLVVKAVIVGLALASVTTWTIFLAKWVALSIVRRRLAGSLALLGKCRTLDDAEKAPLQRHPVLQRLVAAAREEVGLSSSDARAGAIEERAASRLSDIVRTESRAVRHGMSMLATIGSTAPFVGLFGTVWGIMDSFIGISKLQTTNLAVVAPGIAEALLATACGLVAAIPAVVIYNHLARNIRAYGDLLAATAGAVRRLASRSLEQGPTRLDRRAAE